MKTLSSLVGKLFIAFSFLCATQKASSQTNTFPDNGSAGIGTTTPNASSVLDMISSTQGVLVPRMAKTQRDAIASPATGLLIYQTNQTPGFYYYSGTAWTAISGKGPNKQLNNLTAPTGVNVVLQPNADDTIDLGSASFSWKDLYLSGDIYLDDTRFISNQGNNLFIGSGAGTSNTTGFSNTANGNSALYSNSTGNYNTAMGSTALYSNTTANSNTAIGYASLYSNTTGNSNTAIGRGTLNQNTTGFSNTASGSNALNSNTTGSSNTANGSNALYSNTTGSSNTAMGLNALNSNTAGNYNTAIGFNALNENTSGEYNTANGYNSLVSNTTGPYNTAIGSYSLKANTTGSSNTANGYNALYSNTTGFFNTAIGREALYLNTTGWSNTAVGKHALHSNTTGNYNTAIGEDALYSNTTAIFNTAIGSHALHSNLTGESNTAIGYWTLYFNTTGYQNTAIGDHALSSNTMGYHNTANGYQALYSNTAGAGNTANGYQALYSNLTGNSNVANGVYALYSNLGGIANTAIGDYALFDNTTGERNTAIGDGAGSINNKNVRCTFIGYDADQSLLSDFMNSAALGYSSRITASDQVRIGNSSITSIGGYEPWTDVSDSRFKNQIEENVPGLEFINKLKPITYHLDVTGLRKFLGEDITGEEDVEGYRPVSAEQKALIEEGVKRKEQIIYTGFVAQEVEAAAKEIGYDFSGVDAPQNEHSLYGLRYSQFVVPLVKAVQELDGGAKKQESRISILEAENVKLKTEMENLKSLITSNSAMNDGTIKLQTSDSKPLSSEALAKEGETALLGQNIPNPFDNSTFIPFRIPKDCNNASIVISESSTGKIVRAIPVACGETQLTIEAGTLASGGYAYSLYVDGVIVNTRTMVLTK